MASGMGRPASPAASIVTRVNPPPEGESDAEAVFVGGDSAGGGLALSVLLAARERGVRLPDAAFGISAWTDLTQSGASIESRQEVDPVIRERSMLDGIASQYLGTGAAEDPLTSPLLLQVGDAEILLDDTRHGQGTRGRRRGGGGDLAGDVPCLARVGADVA